MIKQVAFAAMLACASIVPAAAKNLALPSSDPVATMWLPDNWETKRIDGGWESTSPDGAVYFSVEYAKGERGIDKLAEQTEKWMARNDIKVGSPKEQDLEIAGLKSKMMSFSGTHNGDDTEVHITFVPAGKNRVLMFTVWASKAERTA
ncbi:MAG: hypothetical protein ACRCTI_21630, partial [Beijerinckiaceae bacterium]